MFLDCARARDPEFAADEADLVHVLAVCRRLDGLPLALELAAARVGLLAPAELAARLDRALVVLTGGARDAPERQRTLRATIEWSTRLLSDTERAAFARMAVFPAGSTVGVAERVTGASLDTLDALVAKQLLARRGGRLVMLETVREYARERLAEDPERDNLTERLAHWAAAFAQEATSHLVRADRAVWLATLEAEVPNLLAALSMTLDAQRAELALGLVVAISEYWWRSNRGEDGLHWIEAVLPSTTAGAPRARATCLLYRARLVGARQTERFRADLEASLELFRTCDDIAAVAACVGHLAIAEYWIGNDERAWVHRDEALRLAERVLGETTGASSFADEALVSAASIPAPSWEGTQDTARRVASHLRRSGHLVGLGQVGSVTGYFAITQRRYRDALGWLEDGLEAARRLEDLTLVYLVLGNQGLARLFLDDLDDAEQAFRAGLALCRRAGCEDIFAEPLLGLAAVAARRDDIERAAILHGAAIGRDEGSRSSEERTIWSRLTDEIIAPTRDRHAGRWERAVGKSSPGTWCKRSRSCSSLRVVAQAGWSSRTSSSLGRWGRSSRSGPIDAADR
jgi:tetratricopeptide (TPR) repeat protein